jgi:anti-sigma regulatory factor (Ser/Thr protein kinase)
MTTSSRNFPGVPGSPGAARRFADGVLALADCPAADLVVACVSELVANSVTHSLSAGPAGVIRVRLVTAAPEWVRLEVRDAGPPPGRVPPQVPRTRPPLGAQSGRGLWLVAHMADSYGFDGRGLAWCRFAWGAKPASDEADGPEPGALFGLSGTGGDAW